jgi:hypothetical protein
MIPHARVALVATIVGLVLLAPAHAQERLGSDVVEAQARAGWTFTPTFGFAETYDDNISLFGQNTADQQNNDYVSTIFPQADLRYVGKHTRLGMGYAGSFTNYQTFSALNRWDQRGQVELRRDESARLKWFAHASGAKLPTTDLIDLGGIPFRRAGVSTADGRGGFDYALGARNSVSSSLNYQTVTFDHTADNLSLLRGGQMVESLSTYRYKLDERLQAGVDYSFRHSSVLGDTEQFNIHTTQAAVDYDVSSVWHLTAGAGVVYLEATPLTASRTGPAWRAALDRRRETTVFHVGYLRSYIPSFGFGGTIQNQEVGASLRMALFHSRSFYTEHGIVLRDDSPLTNTTEQLPLRSLRTNSIFGWAPQPWVRLEAFYARVQQSSLRAGGQLDRNRIGFQIVTSKPMRMQ